MTSTYCAVIVKLVNVHKHPNADKLQLALASGNLVVVGLDRKEGDIGVFFPSDGQLSEKMCLENKLYRKHPETGEPMGGYFEANARVRAQKFRGSESDGYWTELETLAWTGVDIDKLEEGFTFTELKGHNVCQKYYTPATIRAMNQPKSKAARKIKLKERMCMLREHFDTKQLRQNVRSIPSGSVLHFTEKCHGTSGRTGHVYSMPDMKWYHKVLKFLGKDLHKWVYATGTRRVIVDTEMLGEKGFYDGCTFRIDVHKKLKAMGLHKGECFYYELVGFTDQGGQIMHSHKVSDKKMKKRYGDEMVYKYDCVPDIPNKAYRVLVYRITMSNQDNKVIELPWHQVVARCAELGLETVPPLAEPFVYGGDDESLLELCRNLADGSSVLDQSHIREGVCVKVEHPNMENVYKYKGFWFSEFEGNLKNDDNYVDPEDVA